MYCYFVAVCFGGRVVVDQSGRFELMDGLGETLFLFYMLVSLMFAGLPLFIGHVLLLSARMWSFQSYALFGALIGPTLYISAVRDTGIIPVSVGVLIGTLTALAFRLMLHRSNRPDSHKSILTGRLKNRWLAALVLAAMAGAAGSRLMDIKFVQKFFDTGRYDVSLSSQLLAFTVSTVSLALVLWLTNLARRQFKITGGRNGYILAAGLSPIVFPIVRAIRHGGGLKTYHFYLPLQSVLWLGATGWIAMAIFLNLIDEQTSDADALNVPV